ncbi:hypothetical protein CsSME_00009181 [Camellia sinensis var. sinensis]|uniref:Dirigent protein n=1 Tax=Camellia sinensis var. sinensis TaxID=542762 RepID=A0A4S4E0R3_CAMSN|nr:hypothetical protein TEA_005508 [Camellia sinensis var. sinensis]
MGKLLCAILILCSMVMAMPAVHGIAESPKDVEKWFESLNHAKEKLIITHILRPNQHGRQPIDRRPQTHIQAARPSSGDIRSIFTGGSVFMNINLFFTDGEFNGSTLALLGRNSIFHEYREMSIVGGSGVFRLARGIATAKTYSINTNLGDAVVEYHVIAIHY